MDFFISFWESSLVVYRKATYFGRIGFFFSNPVTLLKVFIRFQSFLVMFPGSFKHRTISLQTQIFFDFFLFCFFCVRERYKSMGVGPTHLPGADVEVRKQPQVLVPAFRLV